MNLKKVAKIIIKEFKLNELPIDIFSVVQKSGLKIIQKPLKDTLSGALVTNKQGNSYIIINSGHSHTRQRFSVAHEFSHYLLHRKTADVFVDNYIYRNEKSSTGQDKKEIEANKLAAELLMPEDMVKKKVNYRMINLHDEERINNLAEVFGVSTQAITIRLKNLNLLGTLF